MCAERVRVRNSERRATRHEYGLMSRVARRIARRVERNPLLLDARAGPPNCTCRGSTRASRRTLPSAVKRNLAVTFIALRVMWAARRTLQSAVKRNPATVIALRVTRAARRYGRLRGISSLAPHTRPPQNCPVKNPLHAAVTHTHKTKSAHTGSLRHLHHPLLAASSRQSVLAATLPPHIAPHRPA